MNLKQQYLETTAKKKELKNYTAKIVNGKPVVDICQLKYTHTVEIPSSKLGYDVENDTDMIMNYGGVDAEEIKREAPRRC